METWGARQGERIPRLAWLNGMPGAGKNTAMERIMAAVPGLEPHAWDYRAMATQARANVVGKQVVQFHATPDLSTVVLGVYGDAAAGKRELQGTDLITSVRRTRFKALLAELAERGRTDAVLLEGLLIANRPFVESVRRHVRDARVFTIQTPAAAAKKRYLARNRAMVRAGRLQRMPAEGNWERAQRKVDLVETAADTVVGCADAAAAAAKTLRFIGKAGKARTRRAR